MLKARLVAHGWLPSEAVPALLITEEEAGDLEAIEIGKNTETSPRKRPRGETKGGGPKGSVPVLGNMDVGNMGDALKNIAKNAIDTALKAWENKLPNNMEQNMRKITETTMNTVAAEVVAKVGVPVPVPGAADVRNTKELVQTAVEQAVEALGDFEKEKARVAALRLLLVDYMNEEDDLKFIAKKMRRAWRPGVPLFSDEEIREDLMSAWKVGDADLRKILGSLGIPQQ